MRVYVVKWCNNEQYEDYFETIDSVFSSLESAIKHIEGEGYEDTKERRADFGLNDYRTASNTYDMKHGEYETSSMWVEEYEVKE